MNEEEVINECVDTEQQSIGVFILINDQNDVIDVKSELFIHDITNWIKIDEGYGNKYIYVKSNYFGKNILTVDGDYAYEYVNGEVQEKNQDKNILVRETKARIEALKRLLEESDYKAIKYAEGLLTAEEYEPIKQQRQAWRDEINQLEEEISQL